MFSSRTRALPGLLASAVRCRAVLPLTSSFVFTRYPRPRRSAIDSGQSFLKANAIGNVRLQMPRCAVELAFVSTCFIWFGWLSLSACWNFSSVVS